MTSLAHERFCDEITQQVEELRELVTSGADLSVTVPTCPEWSLEDLLRHTGGALRWVELLVRTRATENIPDEQVPRIAGPDVRGDAAALDAWLAESGAALVTALREAGPDTRVWTWAWRQDAGFWARRMAQELTVHRADAVLAAGRPYRVAPDVAADAIDEWLEILRFVQGTGTDPEANELRRSDGSIHLHATDAPGLDAEWLIEFGEDGFTWRRGHEKATVALKGPLTDLLLAFYRRLPLDAPGLEVLGDRDVLEFWLKRASFG
ncbi:maleylpyruvate isomerase family mycothiol-dependent enzyme [Streptomyces sp. NPDC004783]|uniref:maleylpyruvate isomerase family mycothiol-dependent enzyme n=1 Tax=Streptomyces sp. NPDC004783 TaxID=3154459 RepID=UPI0033B3B6F6